MIRSRKLVGAILLSLTSICAAADQPAGEVGPGVPAFNVRPGYKVTLAASGFGTARFICFGENANTLFVSQPDRGKIICLRDPDADGTYKTITTFASNYHLVQAMQWYKGSLWFAQSGAIHVAKYTKNNGIADEIQDIDCGELREGGGHWYRSLLVHDDGFYTSIGDDQNLSDHPKHDREKIFHYNLDGSNKKLFCTGIRNTEKLIYRPGTKEVWGCDHGSDNFGGKYGEHKGEHKADQPITDLFPPEKVNHYVQDGFYGHPFIMPFHIPRPEFADRPDILDLAAKMIQPEWNSGAHWAGCGWCFTSKPTLTGQVGDMVVAYHGSWNSTKRVGYCVQRIEFDPVTGHPCGTTTLVSTLAPDGNKFFARPVDCAEAPDGSLYFSSDTNGSVYKLVKVTQ